MTPSGSDDSIRRGGVVRFLRYHSAFRALWASRGLTLVGNGVGLLALLIFTAERTGTGTSVALLLLVGDLAPTLCSPLAGALSDRMDRRRLMLLSTLIAALIMCAIAMLEPALPALLVLVGLRSTAGQIASSCSLSAVPDLVPQADLQEANTVLGLGTQGLDFLGPLVTALLLPFIGIHGTLLFTASILLLGALPLLRLPPLPAIRRGDVEISLLGDALEGLRSLWQNPAVRVITLGFVAVVACTGVDDVALVFLAEHALSAHGATASILYAASGAGLLVGYALLSRWGRRLSIPFMLVCGYALNSGGNLLTGFSWAIPPAFATQMIRGVGISMGDVANTTLIQRAAPPGMAGRIFGNIYGAVGMAAALSYVLGGALLDLAGPRVVFVAAGSGGLIATAFVWRTLPIAVAHLNTAEGER